MHICQICEKVPATRVINYPLFLFICFACFMIYQREHDELNWMSIEDYERSIN